jgi:hypothetical protein
VLKLEHFGKQIRNTWEVLKCGAGEGWRSVGRIAYKNEELLHTVEETNILQTIKKRECCLDSSNLA